MERYIKVVLSLLLFLCIADMPYGFYQFVRVVALIVFAILAYSAYENKQMQLMILYIGLGVMFQPFIKIALGREMWNVVDVIVGIGLLASLYFNKNKKS